MVSHFAYIFNEGVQVITLLEFLRHLADRCRQKILSFVDFRNTEDVKKPNDTLLSIDLTYRSMYETGQRDCIQQDGNLDPNIGMISA